MLPTLPRPSDTKNIHTLHSNPSPRRYVRSTPDVIIRCVHCTDASVCFSWCLAFRLFAGVFSPASPSIRFYAGVWIQTTRSMDEIYFFNGTTGKMSLFRNTRTVGSVGDGLVCHLPEWRPMIAAYDPSPQFMSPSSHARSTVF